MELPRASSADVAGWQPHVVRQLNGRAGQIRLPAQFQIVTQSWNRVVAVPYVIYMPEKDRLLMLVNCDYPHIPYIMTSDDHGATWTDPRPVSVDKDGKPLHIGLGTSLTYLGSGNTLLYAGTRRWFSRDYGKTWGDTVPITPASDGRGWHIWDPPLVERDQKTGKVIRLAETGYSWLLTSRGRARLSTGLYPLQCRRRENLEQEYQGVAMERRQ